MSGVDVFTFGETMMALRARGLVRLGAGWCTSVAGAESNVAIGLARLGHAVRWAGRVGDDEPGSLVLRTLRAEGVAVSAVRDPDAPTGLVLFEKRIGDLTRVQYHRAGSAGSRLRPGDLTEGLTAGARVLHLTGVTAALGAGPLAAVRAAADHAAEGGWTLCLDVNHRARLWAAADAAGVLAPLARRAQVLIGSAEEILLAGGVPDDADVAETARELVRRGVREVVVKRGASGASAYTAHGEWSAPAHAVRAVDSIGAGDAFTAGYLSGLLDGEDVPRRLARANAVGAYAVATAGDWEGLPDRGELDLLGLDDGTALR
jgi:sugar/nucleoside kinase (ribokinase family)